MIPETHPLQPLLREVSRLHQFDDGDPLATSVVKVNEVMKLLVEFAEAHPGLVDHTRQCARCGGAIGTNHHTAHGLFDDMELFMGVFGTDHEAYDETYCIPFCDTCFKELQAEQEWHDKDVRPLVERYGDP